MLNKAMVIGRLGKAPEVKYTQSGNQVTTFTIATDESYTDKSGQRQTQTEWHNIVCYGKTAEMCGQYLEKGSLAYVEGRLKTRKWQDRDGRDRYTTEIIADRVQFLDRRKEPQTPGQSWADVKHPPKQAAIEDMDDCPF